MKPPDQHQERPERRARPVNAREVIGLITMFAAALLAAGLLVILILFVFFDAHF